jgi:phage FluMu gp28-like protein
MSKPAVELYTYQHNWLGDNGRFKIGMFARQTGKTFTTTLKITDNCFEAMVQERPKRWVILSRGERQAKEAMDEGVKRHCKAYQIGFDATEFDWKSDLGMSYRALEVTLPRGQKITALPANPDTARGFSASAYLDEFAFHKDSHAIWRALFPVISAGHDLCITSTPNGKNNKFYDLMTAEDDLWSRHVVDIYRAVADGLPRDIEQLRTALADEDAWAQEYELKWLDEASAWLPYDLISSCEDPGAGDPDRYEGGLCYLGNDIAARGDLWVATVGEDVGGIIVVREIVILKRASFAEQDRVMDDLFRRYRIVRACMDQTGMGEKPVEDAKARYGSQRVNGVLFSSSIRLDLANRIKQGFEDRAVRIPEGDVRLRADLHKPKKVMGATGVPRIIVERDAQGHADRFWAMALMLEAASGAVWSADYLSLGRRPLLMPGVGMSGFGRPGQPGALGTDGFGTVRGRLDLRGFGGR